MPQHTHRFRPIWLLVTSPAWDSGYHKVITHAVCIVCGEETYLSAWQSPKAMQGRLGEEGEA